MSYSEMWYFSFSYISHTFWKNPKKYPLKVPPKKYFCPKSVDGNILILKIDIIGHIKTIIEFRYGGGVHGNPIWLLDYRYNSIEN